MADLSHPPVEFAVDSGPFLIAGKHIVSGSVDWAGCDHLTEDRYRESPEIALQISDVIISKDGTIGRVARIDSLPGPATLNGTMMLVRPTRSLDHRYLSHLLNGSAFKQLVEERISGSSVPHLFQRDLVTLPVSLPPLEEQRRIAEILDTIDETIQATQRVIVKYKRVRAGLADVLLSGDSDAADPENWKSERSWADVLRQDQPQAGIRNRVDVRLLDLADSMVDGPFGSALKTEHYVRDAGVRVVRLANLSEGSYLNEDEAFIKEDYARLLSRHDVRSGDVLVASLGDDNHRPGRACLYPVEFAPGIVKADCFRVRPSESVDPRFLMEMLNSRSVASQLRRLSQGVTRDRVNLRQLRWIVLRVPPLDEQRLIAKILDTVDEAVQADEEQLNKLRELRSGLSSDLLSGRVRTVAA